MAPDFNCPPNVPERLSRDQERHTARGLVCAGLLVGAPIALWGRRFAATMMDARSVETALPVAFAALAMIGVALLAAYVPARRAARVHPGEALRH